MSALSNYISYAFSQYHKWFLRMGYPLLDIVKYEDGSWAIIQYETMPVVPSATRWMVVLGPMHHVDCTESFCRDYVKKIDNTKKEFWDEQDRKTKQAEDAADIKEKHAADMAERCTYAVTNNPGLMSRIAENGIDEINLNKIARNIPTYREPTL